MKRYTIAGLMVLLWLCGPKLYSQAIPTASRPGALQLGGGVTWAIPDYGQQDIKGVSGFADFDFSTHLGVEGVYHYVSWFTPTDIGENSLMFGPRYVFHPRRANIYAKVLFGIGTFETQFDYKPHTSDTYLVYGLGGGVDIKATPHVYVRAFDLEYQKWPSFANNGLSPVVMTVGASYVFR